jgi:hypothetical protein
VLKVQRSTFEAFPRCTAAVRRSLVDDKFPLKASEFFAVSLICIDGRRYFGLGCREGGYARLFLTGGRFFEVREGDRGKSAHYR